MTKLVIWRHGQTEWNATGRVQGHADLDLDEMGYAQASAAAPRVAALGPTLIISSDLRRATSTAVALAALTGLDVAHDARLRERDFGPWQGLTGADLEREYPQEYGRWVHADEIQHPAIETVVELAERVGAAFRDAAQQAEDGVAVLVTHGGSARVGCGTLLGWPASLWPTLGTLSNCHYAELRRSVRRGWQLRSHNVG
jgi:glucosyl-3-phosphoglycerate phosphatase